jgi:hypothetical protein
MDKNNAKIANIANTKGWDDAINELFKDPKTGKPLSYADMRCLYG